MTEQSLQTSIRKARGLWHGIRLLSCIFSGNEEKWLLWLHNKISKYLGTAIDKLRTYGGSESRGGKPSLSN